MAPLMHPRLISPASAPRLPTTGQPRPVPEPLQAASIQSHDDGTFKNRAELEAIYPDEVGLSKDDDVIAYCRIGERSSHTWFVLTRLLGFPRVRNYDGSWTEWGNVVGAPIEKP